MNNNELIVEWRKVCNCCNSQFIDKMTKPFPMRVRDFKVSYGICKECRKKRKEGLKKNREAANLYWTFDRVKKFFEDNPPYLGQELLIYDSSHNTNTYAIVTVKVPSDGRQKRIVVEGYDNGYSGQSFYRSGKNCWAPKGQVKLLPYHREIGELIKKSPRGELCISSKEIFDLIGNK